MTAKEVLLRLQHYGNSHTRKLNKNRRAHEPLYGVKMADLKKIVKQTRKNHELSLELYNTGNCDAMYIAGLMADEKKISCLQLERWAEKAYSSWLSDHTVPRVAAETKYGFELGMRWIKSRNERVARVGWSTLAGVAAMHNDSELDITAYSKLLDHVEKKFHKAPASLRYNMNSFIVAVGIYIKVLTDKALTVAQRVGHIDVVENGISHRAPSAADHIIRSIKAGKLGKKRKLSRWMQHRITEEKVFSI